MTLRSGGRSLRRFLLACCGMAAVLALVCALAVAPGLLGCEGQGGTATAEGGSGEPGDASGEGSASSGTGSSASDEGSSDPVSTSSGDVGGEAAASDGSEVRMYTSELDLVGEATRLLQGYREEGSCLLREAGYLDLFGNVWSCTVQGPGWVDVCVVSEGADGGSEVRVVRMDVDEWGRSYGGD